MTKHFLLIGLPGSGKSTIGKKLAEKYQVSFIDLDAWIEESQKMCIRDIFEQFGEAYFRQVEWAALKEVLTYEPCYIALGGGFVMNAVSKGLKKPENVHCIYLNPPLDRLLNHLSGQDEINKRPLLANDNMPLEEKLIKLKGLREPSYRAWADEEWLNY